MTKKKVSVQIEGRNYALITSDDAKYVHSVANEVTKNIRATAQTSKQLDTRDCAILAALNFCDDRNKATKRNQDVVSKADKIIKQANELNKMCNEYKSKLTEAINDNTVLVKKIKELETQLAKEKSESKSLKDENERLKAELNAKNSAANSSQKNSALNNADKNVQNSTANNLKSANNQPQKMPYNPKGQPIAKAVGGDKAALGAAANGNTNNGKSGNASGVTMHQCSLFEDNKDE